MKQTWLRIAWLLSLSLLCCAGPAVADPTLVQETYKRIFGDAVQLDPARRAAVLQDEPGKRHYVDADGDGVPEEVWFVDTALRHRPFMRPLLVRAIDEDGDLAPDGEPDYDSDLYVADWKGDGTVDVVCDYTDRDGDNDVDEMAFYFPRGRGLMVWWGDDVGDDNLLWYDRGYTYDQAGCQFRCHFGGDEIFSAFVLGPDAEEWIPGWENPFVFYDRDNDGVSEEVVRIEGRGDDVHNIRYSFDADNDATWEHPRDYDVSITAHAPKGLTFDPSDAEHRVLRNVPTGRFIRYDAIPRFGLETRWADAMLAWDEVDSNIDRASYADTNERWEGVICAGNEHFRQVGGPHCGTANNRFEVATALNGRLRVYYSPTDHRIHLRGANEMWMAIDADHDRTAEMRYTYRDTDGDGHIDRWEFDADGDGAADDAWTSLDVAARDIAYTWADVNGVMAPIIETAPGRLFALNQRLLQALKALGAEDADPVWELLDSGFACESIPEQARAKLLSSNETLRFYLDVLKDRLIIDLKRCHSDPVFGEGLAELRATGDLAGMRQAVETTFNLSGELMDLTVWRAEKSALWTRQQVAWAQDWTPPNIGWESDVCGYRAYWGQFDFFGKHGAGLVMHKFAEGVNYHQEQPWGMDALHVGATAGIGGATLYVNGDAYPVYSPDGKGDIVWSKRLIEQTDDTVTIELLAENVGAPSAPYTVRFHCTAWAGRRDSAIEVLVQGGHRDDTLELAIGLTKLPHEDFALDPTTGIMANWGIQEPAIGMIGMGIIFPPNRYLRAIDLPDEHQVVLQIQQRQPLRYHIQGTWLRGRRFSRSPVLGNWLDDLRRTAERVRSEQEPVPGLSRDEVEHITSLAPYGQFYSQLTAEEFAAEFGTRAVPYLISLLLKDDEQHDSGAICLLLGETRDPRAVKPIIACIERPLPPEFDGEARGRLVSAIVGLGYIDSEDARSFLLRLATDEYWLGRTDLPMEGEDRLDRPDNRTSITGHAACSYFVSLLRADRDVGKEDLAKVPMGLQDRLADAELLVEGMRIRATQRAEGRRLVGVAD